jgi:hypothetical protein
MYHFPFCAKYTNFDHFSTKGETQIQYITPGTKTASNSAQKKKAPSWGF